MNRRYCCSNDIYPLSYLYHITKHNIIQEETKNFCPPSNACANSADAPYIPSPKGRGFTAHWVNPSIGIILCKDMNKAFVDFVIRDYSKPMGVATYKTSKDMSSDLIRALPNIADLQRLLDTSSNEDLMGI